MDRLIWQNITAYSPQVEAAPVPTAVPAQNITITASRLVYIPQPFFATGLSQNLFVPAWEFS